MKNTNRLTAWIWKESNVTLCHVTCSRECQIAFRIPVPFHTYHIASQLNIIKCIYSALIERNDTLYYKSRIPSFGDLFYSDLIISVILRKLLATFPYSYKRIRRKRWYPPFWMDNNSKDYLPSDCTTFNPLITTTYTSAILI